MVPEFHGGVLRQLLHVVGLGSALNDEAVRPTDDAQIADAVAEAAHHQGFEMFVVGSKRQEIERVDFVACHRFENARGHEPPSPGE